MATAKKKSTSSFVGYGTNVKAGKKISASVQKKVVKNVKSAGTAMGANAKLQKGENYLGGTGIESKRGIMKKTALAAVENKLNRRGERSSKSTLYLGKTKNKRG